MHPHTLSCSCAKLPVMKLTRAWDSELKNACCQGLSQSLAANAPGSVMQIIIPLLQGITRLHGGGCQGANGRLDSRRCPPPPPDLSEARYDCGALVWQERPRACDPLHPTVALAGLIWKPHCNGGVWHHRRPHSPHSEDRSLLPRPSKRALLSAAAFLHSIILDTGCSSCRLSLFANTLHYYGGGGQRPR